MASDKLPAERLVLDPMRVAEESGTPYPPPHNAIVKGRHRRRLSPELGLTRFGVNLVRLEPGGVSSARHWHSHQDECVYIVSGEVTLVTDEGETTLTPGMVAGFPGGNPNGHHFLNKSDAEAWMIEIGDRPREEDVTYPGIDMRNDVREGRPHFLHKDGSTFT